MIREERLCVTCERHFFADHINDFCPYCRTKTLAELLRTGKELMQEHADRIKTLEAGIESVTELIENSNGVYGLHLNGDPAPWGDLSTGGRFEEWLLDFDKAQEPAK
jgi:hypothetical protein